MTKTWIKNMVQCRGCYLNEELDSKSFHRNILGLITQFCDAARRQSKSLYQKELNSGESISDSDANTKE